jgi:hypothetical protein
VVQVVKVVLLDQLAIKAQQVIQDNQAIQDQMV